MYMCNCGKNSIIANQILKKLNDIYPTQPENVTTQYADLMEIKSNFCFPYPPENKLRYINKYQYTKEAYIAPTNLEEDNKKCLIKNINLQV